MLAMFLVGGGILTHGVPWLDGAIDQRAASAGAVAGAVLPLLADALVGLAVGALVLGAMLAVRRLRAPRTAG